MLMQLGTVTFEIYPANLSTHDRDTGADYVAKDILGVVRPREFVGESDETRLFSGILFPSKFGGLSTLDELDRLRRSGQAQILIRGDGKNLGWYMIEKFRERSTYLAADGIGKKIEFDVGLVKSPKPAAASYIATLLRLFY